MQSMPKWRKASHAVGPQNNSFMGLNLLILMLYDFMLPDRMHVCCRSRITSQKSAQLTGMFYLVPSATNISFLIKSMHRHCC